MRQINHLVLHCTATAQTATVESIQRYWKTVKGWKAPGYHFLISPDGKAHNLLTIDKISNGVAGHNHDSIHISYIGGVDGKGRAVDNRTAAQIETQVTLLKFLKKQFPGAEICGHRDFPGVTKECPSFDVKAWLKTIDLT